MRNWSPERATGGLPKGPSSSCGTDLASLIVSAVNSSISTSKLESVISTANSFFFVRS